MVSSKKRRGKKFRDGLFSVIVKCSSRKLDALDLFLEILFNFLKIKTYSVMSLIIVNNVIINKIAPRNKKDRIMKKKIGSTFMSSCPNVWYPLM